MTRSKTRLASAATNSKTTCLKAEAAAGIADTLRDAIAPNGTGACQDDGSGRDFGDTADSGHFYAIGELAEEFSITTRTIRFYEARGLLVPARLRSNRAYSRRDRARLKLILRGKNLGFTLEDIAEYLSLYDSDPGQITQTKLLLDKIEAHISGLVSKRVDIDRTLVELEDIKAQCQGHLEDLKP
jgi:DNA-binding transcriptional MerR regulator